MGKVVAAGDDTPLYFYSHLFSRVAELRSMFALALLDAMEGASGAR